MSERSEIRPADRASASEIRPADRASASEPGGDGVRGRSTREVTA